jgi:predicted nuclease with TOPRIM domain
MPTPPKPFTVLKAEGKSHRTKKELKLREEGEKALATGVALKERPEVKNNPVAHKEFIRINKLLKKIGKNDAIYEAVINRYCLLQAECTEFEERREKFYEQMKELEERVSEMEPDDYFKLQSEMQKNIINLDKQIQSKRKMLFDLEKENIMTIASALRSIPKKTEKNENPLLKALNGS